MKTVQIRDLVSADVFLARWGSCVSHLSDFLYYIGAACGGDDDGVGFIERVCSVCELVAGLMAIQDRCFEYYVVTGHLYRCF